jgi:hypothetical protein
MKIILFIVFLYVLPFVIGWFGMRWLYKNEKNSLFGSEPAMNDVIMVITPFLNIFLVAIIIAELINQVEQKGFPRKFFRL